MLKNLVWKLSGKKLIWWQFFRLYCDAGQPKWYLIPRYRRKGYCPHYGFCICWLGREFNFSFGRDSKELYK